MRYLHIGITVIAIVLAIGVIARWSYNSIQASWSVYERACVARGMEHSRKHSVCIDPDGRMYDVVEKFDD